MTIPEASQLVIQASAMAKGGEVFVLDMGEPIKIAELAYSMIRLSGLSVKDADHPDGDIEVVETGLRPGEKLYEELLIGNNPEPTNHPRIMRARERSIRWEDLEPKLADLGAVIRRTGESDAAMQIVANLVPEYTPRQQYIELLKLTI